MPDPNPLIWPVAELTAAYSRGELSPVDVARSALDRIDQFDRDLHAFVTVDRQMTLEQAAASEQRYRLGTAGPLDGVPVSVKDAFHVGGMPTTLGSLHHRGEIAAADSGVVRRLRAAGAVFTGKTNTAEFGQSATSENLLGPDTANPWDVRRTPGGSSGGAAASVAAALSSLAVGSDGGGSIRIPAAFCGLFGLKPTRGLCRDEDGFRAMTDFVTPGPLAWRAADARPLLGALADRSYPRGPHRPLVIGFCARPEGRPVHPEIVESVERAGRLLEDMGHRVIPVDLDIGGWNEIFGPLVLDDEARERLHLLADPSSVTDYVRRSLVAAQRLDASAVTQARNELVVYRQRISDLFVSFEAIVTPSVAVPAFEFGHRPRQIDGRDVDFLWGAFPFAVPFNVAGTPAATTPSGLVDGMPVGVQIVTPMHTESRLLDLAESLEEAIDFDRSPVIARWIGSGSALTRS